MEEQTTDIVYSRYDTLSFSVAALCDSCEGRYKSTWVDLKISLLLLTRLDPFLLNDSSKSGSPTKNKAVLKASAVIKESLYYCIRSIYQNWWQRKKVIETSFLKRHHCVNRIMLNYMYFLWRTNIVVFSKYLSYVDWNRCVNALRI